MADSSRETRESPREQGVDEQINYKIDTVPWGGSPSAVVVVVKDVYDNHNDVTGTVTTGSPSVTGDEITLPKIRNLVAGKRYRVEVKFTSNGNVLEPYFFINAKL